MPDTPIPSIENTTSLALSSWEKAGFAGLCFFMFALTISIFVWLLIHSNRRFERAIAAGSMTAQDAEASKHSMQRMVAAVQEMTRSGEQRMAQIVPAIASVQTEIEQAVSGYQSSTLGQIGELRATLDKLAARHEDPGAPFSTVAIRQEIMGLRTAMDTLKDRQMENRASERDSFKEIKDSITSLYQRLDKDLERRAEARPRTPGD